MTNPTKAVVDEVSPVRGLTIYQPWADAIVHLRKNVENRTWIPPYTGLLLIHSAKDADTAALKEVTSDLPGVRRAVLAVARLDGCRQCDGTCSPWAEPSKDPDHPGKPTVWHWEITHVHGLTSPVPWPGARKLWIPNPELCARVADVLPPEAAHLRPYLLAHLTARKDSDS